MEVSTLKVESDDWTQRYSRIYADTPHLKLLLTNFDYYPVVSKIREIVNIQGEHIGKATFPKIMLNLFQYVCHHNTENLL